MVLGFAAARKSMSTPSSASQAGDEEQQSPQLNFNRKRTIAYFLYHMRMLPTIYTSLDTNRMTALYFCLSGLDLMDALDHLEQPRERIVEWIYAMQILPTVSSKGTDSGIRSGVGEADLTDKCGPTESRRESSLRSGDNFFEGNAVGASRGTWKRRVKTSLPNMDACRDCGFIGSPFMGGTRFDPTTKAAIPDKAHGAVHGHIAMTYTALASLIILGDDLGRVAREPILSALAQLQQDDGRFVAHHRGGESDCRFLYCACAVAFILGGVRSHMNVDAAQHYVRSCVNGYDGSIGLIPGQESHGGACYTALAGLGLCAEALGETLDLEALIGLNEHAFAKWCLSRQVGEWSGDSGVGGFQGRMNKVADTCYTFWVLGALQVLDRGKIRGNSTSIQRNIEWLDLYDAKSIRRYLLSECSGTHDHLRGGFGKIPGALPDVLHSYYGVCGLSLVGNAEDAILPLDASLSISQRARSWLKEIHLRRSWG